MYIMRLEWKIKPGHMGEALAALRKMAKAFPYPKGARVIYTSFLGEFGRISYDIELDRVDDWVTLNADVGASPEGKEFWKIWNELVVDGSAQAWKPDEV